MSPAPLFGRAPTGTELPSLNDSVPDITSSDVFGLSYSAICEVLTVEFQVNRIQAPANSPTVAHSLEESPG
jgi:hypothetical protein